MRIPAMGGILGCFLISIFAFLSHLSTASVSQLEKGIKREIQNSFPSGTVIELENLKITTVPETSVVTNIQPQPPLGLVSLEFSWSEGQKTKRAFLTAKVRAYLPIAVAKGVLRHGQRIQKEDLVFEKRELSPFVRTGYVHDASSLLGKEVVGFIRPGQVITSINLRSVPLIARGQGVEVRHETAALRMVAKMKALESGHLNDWIRLENQRTRKVIHARVTGNGETSLH